jgi:hypothetical protein
MKRFALIIAAAMGLSACAENKPDVSVTRSTGKVQTKSRSEPIFYNGKTYQLDFSYLESASVFDMKVSGMGAKQQKDAVAVATSSLGYFACPEGQKGRLANTPKYDGGKWLMQARCG